MVPAPQEELELSVFEGAVSLMFWNDEVEASGYIQVPNWGRYSARTVCCPLTKTAISTRVQAGHREVRKATVLIKLTLKGTSLKAWNHTANFELPAVHLVLTGGKHRKPF